MKLFPRQKPAEGGDEDRARRAAGLHSLHSRTALCFTFSYLVSRFTFRFDCILEHSDSCCVDCMSEWRPSDCSKRCEQFSSLCVWLTVLCGVLFLLSRHRRRKATRRERGGRLDIISCASGPNLVLVFHVLFSFSTLDLLTF